MSSMATPCPACPAATALRHLPTDRWADLVPKAVDRLEASTFLLDRARTDPTRRTDLPAPASAQVAVLPLPRDVVLLTLPGKDLLPDPVEGAADPLLARRTTDLALAALAALDLAVPVVLGVPVVRPVVPCTASLCLCVDLLPTAARRLQLTTLLMRMQVICVVLPALPVLVHARHLTATALLVATTDPTLAKDAHTHPTAAPDLKADLKDHRLAASRDQ